MPEKYSAGVYQREQKLKLLFDGLSFLLDRNRNQTARFTGDESAKVS